MNMDQTKSTRLQFQPLPLPELPSFPVFNLFRSGKAFHNKMVGNKKISMVGSQQWLRYKKQKIRKGFINVLLFVVVFYWRPPIIFPPTLLTVVQMKKVFYFCLFLLSCWTAGWHCEVVKAPRAPRPTKACSPLLRCNYYAIYEVNCFAISLFNKILHPSNSPQSNLTACLRSQIGWRGMETGSCQIAGWEISGDKLAESFHTGIPINAASATTGSEHRDLTKCRAKTN